MDMALPKIKSLRKKRKPPHKALIISAFFCLWDLFFVGWDFIHVGLADSTGEAFFFFGLGVTMVILFTSAYFQFKRELRRWLDD